MISRTVRFSKILIATGVLALGANTASASEGESKADKYFAKAAQYEMQGNFEKAAKYRAKAEKYSAHGEDEAYESKAEKYAAKAARYAAAGDLEKAAKYAAKALKYANEDNNSKAAKYSAKAEQAAIERDFEKASYYAAKAEKYAKKYGDNCWPVVTADFDENGFGATVESSKDLSNIVMLFADGTTQRYEALEGNELMVAGSNEHSGKVLTGVWIKSGCNHSGDGPGYGEFVENTGTVTGLPVVSIHGEPRTVELHEGDISEAMFTVSLSEMVPLDGEPVTVVLITSDGSAEAYTDYVPEERTLTFEPGEVSLQYSVLIIGDRHMETQEENYFVELTNPSNALLGQATATGWIFDDDDTDY